MKYKVILIEKHPEISSKIMRFLFETGDYDFCGAFSDIAHAEAFCETKDMDFIFTNESVSTTLILDSADTFVVKYDPQNPVFSLIENIDKIRESQKMLI